MIRRAVFGQIYTLEQEVQEPIQARKDDKTQHSKEVKVLKELNNEY
jgi:hypothetical protein